MRLFYRIFFCISFISYHPNMLKITFLVSHLIFFILFSGLLCILLCLYFPAAGRLRNCAAWCSCWCSGFSDKERTRQICNSRYAGLWKDTGNHPTDEWTCKRPVRESFPDRPCSILFFDKQLVIIPRPLVQRDPHRLHTHPGGRAVRSRWPRSARRR